MRKPKRKRKPSEVLVRLDQIEQNFNASTAKIAQRLASIEQSIEAYNHHFDEEYRSRVVQSSHRIGERGLKVMMNGYPSDPNDLARKLTTGELTGRDYHLSKRRDR